MMKRLFAAVTGLVLAANVGLAAETTTNMAVSATVNRTCTVSAASLAFGALNATTPTDALAAITISCTAGSAADTPTVTFGLGANFTGAQRYLKGGDAATPSALIPYGLFSDTGRSVAVTGSTAVATATSNAGVTYSTSIYGRVAASPSFQLGTYSDTVVVTVTYRATGPTS